MASGTIKKAYEFLQEYHAKELSRILGRCKTEGNCTSLILPRNKGRINQNGKFGVLTVGQCESIPAVSVDYACTID